MIPSSESPQTICFVVETIYIQTDSAGHPPPVAIYVNINKPCQVDVCNIETLPSRYVQSPSRYVHTSTWRGLLILTVGESTKLIVIIWSICACACVVNLCHAAALQEPARFCHGTGKRSTRYNIIPISCSSHPYCTLCYSSL